MWEGRQRGAVLAELTSIPPFMNPLSCFGGRITHKPSICSNVGALFRSPVFTSPVSCFWVAVPFSFTKDNGFYTAQNSLWIHPTLYSNIGAFVGFTKGGGNFPQKSNFLFDDDELPNLTYSWTLCAVLSGCHFFFHQREWWTPNTPKPYGELCLLLLEMKSFWAFNGNRLYIWSIVIQHTTW